MPGYGWTAKKLRAWVQQTFGTAVSRGTLRRWLHAAGLTWKKVKKLLGKGSATARADHVAELQKLFVQVCAGEILLVYVDEAHVHRDMDPGYTWGRKGQRVYRTSSCPRLADRINWYGAFDFTNGECLWWNEGHCNGQHTAQFLERLAQWRSGRPQRVVLLWDNAPCHKAKVAQDKARDLGMQVIPLPTYSPDLNPIERLWAWLREEVTRGHCYPDMRALFDACKAFLARINQDPHGIIDRLWPKFDLDPVEEKLRFST